jgi:hypothetical protein
VTLNDIILLAGYTYDNSRVVTLVLNRTGRLLADAGSPTLIDR